jgi:hypothetical protein
MDAPACGTCGGPAPVALGDILDEVKATRAAIEGPTGLNVRVAVVEAGVKALTDDVESLEDAVKANPRGRLPDARWVGGVLGAVLLTLLTAAGILTAQPSTTDAPVDPCVITCDAIGLGDGAVGADGVCECGGWSLADTGHEAPAADPVPSE